ncbi:hypothetical protein [Pedobacter changchengzhani]|uniref:hypothetical protein n=1 Tax=Pedobacter changchengzhani TaxID=2529274 RepID=UPI0014046EBF|nr:hypothetical protein [Pedobacter changchengzhani]
MGWAVRVEAEAEDKVEAKVEIEVEAKVEAKVDDKVEANGFHNSTLISHHSSLPLRLMVFITHNSTLKTHISSLQNKK